ncbi:hypothetical protein IW245_000671 [Longispora fulva]|uniref:Uncharacterized protein n=1 Tax=Longispora fulva TaxID=619741 RepID=A0A8J7KUV1_9ACTN|nr:hypothetical protein [Longispora fulva]
MFRANSAVHLGPPKDGFGSVTARYISAAKCGPADSTSPGHFHRISQRRVTGLSKHDGIS